MRVCTILAFFVASLFLLGFSAPLPPPAEGPPGASFGELPIYFIENQGQLTEEVAFYVQGSDKAIYFTDRGVTFALAGESGRWTVKLSFKGAQAKPQGEEPTKAIFNYFRGNRKDWKQGIPSYGKVVYRDLWPGIDLVYSGTARCLKYAFLLQPGADPGKIRLKYDGAAAVALKDSGTLQVTTPAASFEDGRPVAYQTIQGKKVDVPLRYALDKNTFGFEVGDYDRDQTLVLDPAIFVYSGFIGGVSSETAYGVKVDEKGYAYVVGFTDSYTGFPVKVGPDLTLNGLRDAFVAKVDASGNDLIYCGFIGGEENDIGFDVAIDDLGNAYVIGATASDENTFPVKNGPDLTYNGGDFDAFVAKVVPSGEDLDYCGYIGGAAEDQGQDIAVDNDGNAYATGYTASDEGTFPVLVGPDLTYNGGDFDAFVTKVNSKGTGLVYSGYLGGEWSDMGFGIAVNHNQYAFLAGGTLSDETTFPVVTGPNLVYDADGDGYVAKLIPNPNNKDPRDNYAYCGYITGNSFERCYDVAVDVEDYAYLTGYTDSPESCFLVVKGPDVTHNGYGDAFAAKVIPDPGNPNPYDNFIYCGYIGGEANDQGRCIGLWTDMDQTYAFVAGFTASTEGPDPMFPSPGEGPDDSFNGGTYDAFVAQIISQPFNADPKDNYMYCGYIGGTDWDQGFGIAVDGDGAAYVVGGTWSTEADGFPVVVGPDLFFNGLRDAFVSKVGFKMPLEGDTSTLSVAEGGIVHFTLSAGAGSAGRPYLLLGSMSPATSGIPLPGGKASMPFQWDAFTGMIISLMNTPIFLDFNGTLSALGDGSAQFDTLGPLPAGTAPTTLHFAYALAGPWDYVSNKVEVEIIP